MYALPAIILKAGEMRNLPSDKYSLQQPLINPVFNTRQWEVSLLRWSGNNIGMQDYVKAFWEKKPVPAAAGKEAFL